jgi:hypothetical protein
MDAELQSDRDNGPAALAGTAIVLISTLLVVRFDKGLWLHRHMFCGPFVRNRCWRTAVFPGYLDGE